MVDANKLIERGQAAQAQGNDSAALDYFQQALSVHPKELNLEAACGNLCVQLARFEEAAAHFRRILVFNKSPDVRKALCFALQSLGNNAHIDGKYALAEACFEEVLQHQPSNAAYWYNLANAQRELGKLQSAISSFEQSVKANPNDADTRNNLGNVQRELGQLDLAIASYREALRLDPNLHHALVHLIHQKQHVCDWQGQGNENISQQIQKVRALVNTTPEAQISPFAFLAMSTTTAEEQKICANNYVAKTYQHLFDMQNTLNFTHNRDNKKKLHIGYLSADFRLHPLAFLITELIEQHDKDEFTVSAYSYGAEDETDTRKRLMKAFDYFVDIRDFNDVEAANKINQDKVDILVDLTGFTQSSRTAIVALKPAAVSISWLGFPGTMGIYKNKPLFDYILADATTAPNKQEFAEHVLQLPCYQPNSQREMAPETLKSSHHLPDDSFVFCSFNQTFKITPDIFAIWMRLLQKVSNSVLWLLECNKWAKKNLQHEAELAGIEKTRLIFASRTDSKTHIERQRHADLFLDTLPYNAHTTASDALYAGLPVLTCKGNTFAANVAASIISHAGLPELICESLEQYEETAYQLASNQSHLAEIKKQVSHLANNSDLFNSEKFARLLESTYHDVWQRLLNTPNEEN